MLSRSWLPNLRARLQPLSRSQRRRLYGRVRRRGFEHLEARALLTTYSTSFDVKNHSQFGSGNAAVSSGTYFLGAQNFDTGTQTIGGFVQPLGVTTGVQASVDLNGTAGLNLGYFVNSGSVSAAYNGNLTQNFTDPTQIGNVSVNTGVALSNGTLSTQSPSFGAYADADVQLGGSLDVSAAGFGESYSNSFPLNGGINQELFSINRNNDQSLNVLGQPQTFNGTVGVQVSEAPPVSINATVSTANNPLGARETMSVALEQNDGENTGTGKRQGGSGDENGGGNSGSVSFQLGSASQTVPVVQLSASQTDGSGNLSASTTDGNSTQLANMQLQMGVLAAAALNLPPAFTTMEFSVGPATVDLTPLSFTMGPTLYAHQSVNATPVSTITYVFDHPVDVVLNGVSSSQVGQITFNPGDALQVKFDGTPIHVTPYWNFDLQFHNKIDLDVSMNAKLTVGQITALLNGVPAAIQDALGLPVTAGPLYQQDFNLANLPAITAYDQTFDLLNKSVQMPDFTIGANFQPSLKVTTTQDDSSATQNLVTLRDAVNSANFLASQNGTNEGADVILLGPGTYSLTDIVGQGQTDDGTVGNLLVTDPNLTIIGAGSGQTFIDASNLGDRAFQVLSGGSLHLEGLTIQGGNASHGTPSGQSSDTFGGGIYNAGTLVLDDVNLSGNKADSGGGIYNQGNETINHSTFAFNRANKGGGGIDSLAGQTAINGSTFSGNSADLGGGLLIIGSALIQASAFNNNQATYGGAINNQGSATVVSSSFSGNSATLSGGAIENNTNLTAVDDSFVQNSSSANGGAIDGNIASTTTITGSTFSGNFATRLGGALDEEEGANRMDLTNCTLVGNHGSDGGAVYNSALVTIASSTITANSAANSGGGIVAAAGILDLHNDIVAKNTLTSQIASDVSGAATSQGHNLIGDGSGSSGLTNGVNSDQVGSDSNLIDPKLGPLQDNGGATQTMALQSGSPAIDAGDDNNAPATDQRGFARPSGSHVDIGAVEFIHSPLVIPDFGDDNVTVSGSIVTQNITLRDAVKMFNAQGGTNEIDLLAGEYDLTHTPGDPTPSGAFGDLIVQNEDLTIVGQGVGQTIIDVKALGYRAFDILASGHLHLVGVTITGGESLNDGLAGGAILNAGTLTLANSAITNSIAHSDGGAIYSTTGSSLTLNGATISGNSAQDGGGIYAAGSLSIANSSITGNSALKGGAGFGGGLAAINATGATITLSTISDNSADGDGGGIADTGALTISGSTIDGNTAGDLGGGIVTNPTSGTLTISQASISSNTAQFGGGLFSNAPANISGSTFASNIAQGAAGQDGSGSDPSSGGGGGGGAGIGAAIFNQSNLTLANSTLVGNQAIGGNGGRTESSAINVGGAGGGPNGGAGGTTTDGAAGQFGGGGGGGGYGSPPANGGAGGFGGGGGGAGGLATNVLRNQPPSETGGVGGQCAGAGGNTVNNRAGGGGGGAGLGGALFNLTGQLTLSEDTIVDNGASGGLGGFALNGGASGAAGTGAGGGVYVFGGSVSSQNTVLARNTANQNPDVSGAVNSLGHNFIGNVGTASGFINQTAGDQVGGGAKPTLDPKLGPLQNNGGTTLTEAPLAGSPLIDAGANSGASVAVDQAGGKRIIGGTVDIGAVENQTLYVNTTQDQLGVRSLRQAIQDADALGGQQTIMLGAGTYRLTGLGHLDVHNVSLSIVGAGAGQTIIDASQANDRDFTVASGAALSLSGLTIENGNAHSNDGGDVLNNGTLTISNSELKGGSAELGGAIANESTGANLTINSSTLDGNTAHIGGAIYNQSGAMSITNSTVAGNTATGDGGGIAEASPSANNPVMLLNDTIAGNQAQNSGGGIAASSQTNAGSITLKNTLVAGNQAATSADLRGAVVSQGHNLIGNVGGNTSFTPTAGDLVGGGGNPAIDPKLGPLQNNGGATPTMLPAVDSPAVDAGDNNGAPSTDQRGIRRPLGGTVDIGAAEAVFLAVTRFDDGNLPGQLRRAIRDANDLGGSHTITLPAGVYHLTVQGANESRGLIGDLDILSNVALVGAGADQTMIDASALGDRAFYVQPDAMFNLSGVTIEGGSTSDRGGAIYNDRGTVVISRSELKNNSAHQGGAVDNGGLPTAVTTLAMATNGINAATGTLVVSDASQFPATLPFAVQIDQEQLTVTDVAGNTLFVSRGANGTIAAPHNFGSPVSVVGSSASSVLTAINSTISVNSLNAFPSTPGFLIQIDSELMQVVGVSRADNSFTVVRGFGGTSPAAHQQGAKVGQVTFAIDSSTLDGNSSGADGGAVNNESGMLIVNSTLYGNTSGGQGGGIVNNGRVLVLANDTIAGNMAANGGGVRSAAGSSGAVQLHNTIVATNVDATSLHKPNDVSGAFASLGHNLIGVVGTANGLANGANGDQVGNVSAAINPLLSALRNNGSPLPTMALLSGSPAIDAGDNAGAPPADERSILRNQGANVDIGAYELTYDLQIDLPGGGTQSVFTDLGQGLTQMTSPNGAFGTFTFENPSHSLTIVSHSGGNDTIAIGPLESGFAVGVVGDGQGDKIQLLGGAVLNPIGGETILSGDTLAGVGTVATPLTINSGGTLAPDAADPLTVAASLTLIPGAQFVETIDGTNPGSDYDQLVVTGALSTVNLGGATLSATRLASFVPSLSDTFTIISNQTGNPIVGTFAGLPEGAVLDIGGIGFSITYHGGVSGSDVVLQAVAPSVSSMTISPTEGAPFSGTVAAFATADPAVGPSDFTATIAWGDGHTSAGTILGSAAAGFMVTGANTYAEEGSYPVNVIVSQHGILATAASTAQVVDAPLAATAATIAATEGMAFSGVVATFTDADPNGVASDYSATIVWGDGQTSAGTISGSQPAGFTVLGANTYADEGSYPVSVVISDHGNSASAASAAQVVDAPLTAGAFTPPAVVEGTSFFGTVFHFTDANPAARATDFQATMNLGDGSSLTLLGLPSPNGVIVPNPQGGFDVQVSHTYAEELSGGTFSVAVQDIGGSSITASTNNFSVADAPLTAGALTPPVAVEGSRFSGTVFHFTDANPSAKFLDYTARVNLGDGNRLTLLGIPSVNGAIVPSPQGGFDVQLSYTYAEELTGATFGVVVSDAGGSSVTASGVFGIADAPLAGGPAPIAATEGAAFSGAAALFTDADPNGVASDYAATIAWGDGQTSVGTISGTEATGFTVSGANAYAEEGSYPVGVVISDHGSMLTITGTAQVLDAPLAATATAIAASEGLAFSGTVGSFTDADPNGVAGDYAAAIAWGDGQTSSGTISGSQATGFKVTGAHTYADEGSYPLSIVISDHGSSASAASTAQVVDAPLTAGAFTPPSAVEGIPFFGTVFHFTDANPAARFTDFKATVNLGDGNSVTLLGLPSPNGSIVPNSQGGFDVQVSHTYGEELSGGTFSVAVQDIGGSSITASTNNFSVADAPLIAGALTPPAAVEGSRFSGTVFHFTDANPAGRFTDYTATVNLGDGNSVTLLGLPSPNGAIVPNAQGGFDVQLSYTYAEEMTNATFSVVVSDAGGSSITSSSLFSVADAPLTGSLAPITTTEGAAFNSAIAVFTDADPNGVATDYNATITWGDGQTSAGTITGSESTGFTVSGANTYAEEGSYPLSVVINDQGGSLTIAGTAQVLDAPLSATAAPVATTEGAVFNGVVATFADADPNGVASDYAATIMWGDGQTSAGTVSGSQATGFTITGSNTYAYEGSYPVNIIISDHGSSASATSTAQVADAPLSASGVNIKALDGTTTGQKVVATFVDQGGAESVADYSATIDWGDGSSSAGVEVANADGSFSIQGNHAYFGVGSFTITTSITHENGIAAQASSTASVDFGGGLLVLDPTGLGALNEIGNGMIQVKSGDVRVDSNSRAAIVAIGNGTLSANDFLVSGTPGVFTLGKTSLQGTVESGAPALADPLAGVPAPVASSKPNAAVNAHGSQHLTLQPGTYAGGISASGNAMVTLSPGIYYLQGGGLSVSGNAIVTGDGVTIYNAKPAIQKSSHDLDDNAINLSGNATLRISAPTSGPLKNIAIFQDRSLVTPILIDGAATAQVTGLIYAAQAALVISGGAQLDVFGNSQTGLVAACICDDVSVLGNATLSIDGSQNPAAASGPAAVSTPSTAGTTNTNTSPSQPVQTLVQDSYFQKLLASQGSQELKSWIAGFDLGNGNDEFGLSW